MTRKSHRNLRSALLPSLAGLTRYAPVPVLLAVRPGIAAALQRVPGWRARVQRSMAAALGPDGFEPGHIDDYFRHLADLVVFAVAVYRSDIHCAGLERNWLHDEASRRRCQEALELGKGVVLAGAHLIGHEVLAGTVTGEIPIAVLVRKAPDPRYEAIKQRWYSALGVEVVYRPPRDARFQSLGEMTAALRILRKNRALAITPDLIQKPGTGIPVRLFGRPAELPAGAFFLAARTGAPLLPAFTHYEEGRYRLWTHEALFASPGADRDSAIAEMAQRWTTLFEEFVRAHPDMWQFWLDKRWAKWLDETEAVSDRNRRRR
jgi:lauroyl/myristoyl acyltransferase